MCKTKRVIVFDDSHLFINLMHGVLLFLVPLVVVIMDDIFVKGFGLIRCLASKNLDLGIDVICSGDKFNRQHILNYVLLLCIRQNASNLQDLDKSFLFIHACILIAKRR